MLERVNLSGLLSINGQDMWASYGVFLYEENPNDSKNFAALLKPSSVKPIKAIAYAEEDGERLPKQIKPQLEARDVTLTFGILAPSGDFARRYQGFCALIRSGWLEIQVNGLGTYKMIYQGSSDYKQITDLGASVVGGYVSIKFREPSPRY